MPRPIALLDVDHTLLTDNLTSAGSILEHNTSLTEALKAKGILDVYLLTDMKFSREGVQERVELIQYLRGQGFAVHGVITPCDIHWTTIPTEESLIYMDAGMQNFPGRSREESLLTRTRQYIESRSTELPGMQGLLSYEPASSRAGAAFEEAKAFYLRTPSRPAEAQESKESVSLARFNSPEHIYKHSDVTKSWCDALSGHCGYSHSKGLLLDLFLSHKPEWVSSVLVADDREEVIAAVSEFKPVSSLRPYLIPALSALKVTPDFATKRFMTPQKEYEIILEEHLKKDPIVQYRKSIEVQIKKLCSWSLFLRNSNQKIMALNALLMILQTVSSLELRHAFVNWRANNDAILSEHRNVFKPKNRPRLKTGTQSFADDLIAGLPMPMQE